MDRKLIKELLETNDIFDFTMIIWKNKIPIDDWQGNYQIYMHYKYLKENTIHFDEVTENIEFFRCSQRKAKEEREIRKHSD